MITLSTSGAATQRSGGVRRTFGVAGTCIPRRKRLKREIESQHVQEISETQLMPSVIRDATRLKRGNVI